MWSDGYNSGLPAKPERANIDLPRDTDGNTYLHELCRRDAPVELIREAVEKLGANVNALNKKNLPALGIAIMNAKPETIACLIDLGAELNFPVNKSSRFNATYLAAQQGKGEALDVVLKKGGALFVNERGIDGDGYDSSWTPLTVAIKGYKNHVIDQLISAGALLNLESGPDKLTPLLTAVAHNSDATIRKLLDAGADIDQKQGDTGRTALLYAIARRQNSAARCLLNSGANADAADKDGLTPLMLAAENADTGLAEALISKGAIVDLRRSGNNGETALMKAAAKGSSEVARVLLKAGADPTLADNFNKTAAKYAENGYNWGVRSVLDEAEQAALQKQFENSYKKYRP